MKLFDIAISFLDYDFKSVDIYDAKKSQQQLKSILTYETVLKKYRQDSRVLAIKQEYASDVFAVALYHKLDKAHRDIAFYDVFFEIYDAHKKVLTKKYEKYRTTDYPAIMFRGWNKYISEIKNPPYYLIEYETCSRIFIMLFDYHDGI